MDASRIPQTKREFRFESSGERAGKLRLYHRQQCRFQGDTGPPPPLKRWRRSTCRHQFVQGLAQGQQRLRVLSKLRDERDRAACKWAEHFGSAVELLRLVGSGGLLLRELAIATLDLFRRDVLDMGANPPLIA